MSKRLITRTNLSGRIASAWAPSRSYAEAAVPKFGRDIQPKNYRKPDGTYEVCDEILFLSIIGHGEDLRAVNAAKEGVINTLVLSRYNKAAPKQ
jgi:hypothetical protein